MELIYYYPTKELMFYQYHSDLYDIEKIVGEIGTASKSFPVYTTQEGVGYWYRVGEYERQRGRAFSKISYVTIWYQDDFRQEYSPEFIKEMEIQEKVWQFKLLFKKLEK